MNKRALYVLLGVLVAQIALAVFTWWPRNATVEAGPLLPDLTPAQITAFTVSDTDGHHVRLARSGEGWVLPEADDYPALSESVKEALNKLLAVTRAEVITETAASHTRLQVTADNYVRRIDLETSDGPAATLYLGSSLSYGDSNVRLADEDVVYRGTGLTPWEWGATPAGWVDTQYVNIALDEVTAVTILNGHGECMLTRTEAGGWALAGQAADDVLDEDAANTLVQQAATLRLTAPLSRTLDPAYGLDKPQATVTLRTAKGDTTVLVGAQQPDGGYAAKSSAAEYAVEISSYVAESLLNASVDTLRKAPETPTPTPAQ